MTSVDTRSVVPPRSRCPLHPVGSTPRAFSSLVNLSSLSCVVRALVGGAAGNGTNGTVRGRWQMDLVWAGLVGVGLGEVWVRWVEGFVHLGSVKKWSCYPAVGFLLKFFNTKP